MIYTSSYKDFNTNIYKGVSISTDRGKDANFNKDYYLDLAPKKTFWKKWKNNRGIVPEIENNTYYIEEYYKQVLSKLNPSKIYNDLYNSFLLCYESNNEFCHRHIVSAWLELFIDIKIKEVKVDGSNIIEVEKPTYIKETLEKVIKENTNMRGFNNLRALYLCNLSDEFEKEINLNPNKNNTYLNEAVNNLREKANTLEKEYNNKNKIKKLIKDE